MKHRTVPEAFHPGEYIKLALEGKGWIQLDLAAVMDKPPSVVNDIINGRRPITPEIAKTLGEIFDNGAQVWLNLQTAYQLAMSSDTDNLLARRRKLYERAPIREMQKRHWIEESNNVKVLESQFCRFAEIDSVDDEIKLKHAARKSEDYKDPTDHQLIWLVRARHLATRMVEVPKYKESQFENLLHELSILKAEPESVTAIPELLRTYGIRFLVVEYLPRTKIDGATFWLNRHSPVVVVSLRYDRIDSFWYTLVHELMHVKRGDCRDKPLIETSLVGDDAQPKKSQIADEREVNKLARQFLVDQDSLHDFVARRGPLFSRAAISQYARMIRIHPGIIVGQLHYTGDIPYRNFRSMLVKVRDLISSTALTDGWGHIIAA